MSSTDKENEPKNEGPLVLRFSHNVIEHLGLKLYQNKPTNVIAELVSNSWDADAELVDIQLRTDSFGNFSSIVVFDDGSGMPEKVLRENYLVVGKIKRDEDNADARSPRLVRKLMGRKGIGKLAPFGIAKTVDLLTVSDGVANWLRFDYGKIKREEKKNTPDPTLASTYQPEVLAENVDINALNVKLAGDDEECVEQFLAAIQTRRSGTLIRAADLTVKRALSADALAAALGRRFTVTLNRSDFRVLVNKEVIEEKHAFPDWELRIPESGVEEVEVDTPDGKKNVKCWVGFVGKATWSQDEAGVGVYAHGKIAQDRPFFFKVRGSEIFTRYMYAVVEADWVDERPADAISTDRTSINWEDEEFSAFHKWGAAKVNSWLSQYESHRKAQAEKENRVTVDEVVKKTDSTIRESEKEHLVKLLSDVTPRLGKEAENKEKLVEATVRAWTHEPARRLIKKLWDEASQFEADSFAQILGQLTDQLVPESLSLAVVFSQRVYALSQLENHIMRGKETQLQSLLEEFPWIIDSEFERFVPRNSLKTICDKAFAEGLHVVRPVHVSPADHTKPDFVFLGATVTGNTDHILVVELKGPDDTAGWPEYEQLNSYVSYLKSRFGDANVEGILIARSHDQGIKQIASRAIRFKEWNHLLLKSRKDHMELIAALLAGSRTDAKDSRVQQICELGGEAVTGFLASMAERDSALAELVEKLGPKAKKKGADAKQLGASPYQIAEAEIGGADSASGE